MNSGESPTLLTTQPSNCQVLLLEFWVGVYSLLALIRRKTAQFYRLCQDEEETKNLLGH